MNACVVDGTLFGQYCIKDGIFNIYRRNACVSVGGYQDIGGIIIPNFHKGLFSNNVRKRIIF